MASIWQERLGSIVSSASNRVGVGATRVARSTGRGIWGSMKGILGGGGGNRYGANAESAVEGSASRKVAGRVGKVLAKQALKTGIKVLVPILLNPIVIILILVCSMFFLAEALSTLSNPVTAAQLAVKCAIEGRELRECISSSALEAAANRAGRSIEE